MPELFGMEVSEDVLALNQEHMQPQRKQTPRIRQTLAGDTDANAFAAEFEQAWQVLGGPQLVREHRFHPTRQWRLDYYHEPSRIAIELEGGIYTQGRHVRGRGYVEDCIKYNAALAQGIRVFRIATGMVQPEHLEQIIDAMKGAGHD